MNIFYTGMYLEYLVPACKGRLIAIATLSELLAISYLRAFIIVIYGKFNSSCSLFYGFFMWQLKVNRASLISK